MTKPKKAEIAFGRTLAGQLLYDLMNLKAETIAKKHRMPLREVRRMLMLPDIKKLRTTRDNRP